MYWKEILLEISALFIFKHSTTSIVSVFGSGKKEKERILKLRPI